MQEIVCKKCQYAWKYAGDKHRTSCPRCKTSVTLRRHYSTYPVTETVPVVPTDFKFPYRLWKDARFIQRMQNLPSMGEDHITLKTDINGVLSL